MFDEKKSLEILEEFTENDIFSLKILCKNCCYQNSVKKEQIAISNTFFFGRLVKCFGGQQFSDVFI